MPAILTQGTVAIRDALKTLVSHVGVATDQTAFNVAQTAVDPANGGSTNVLVKASTDADIGNGVFESTIPINGDTEMTGKNIYTISACDGATRTDALTRTVRSQPIGVQAGDLFTIGVQWTITDETA